MNEPVATVDVLRMSDIQSPEAAALLARFGLELCLLAPASVIPGSFWGESEAGLIGSRILVRPDTPLHSLLHEACHWIVMDPEKRPDVHTDASDSQLEENATCYLQLLLADELAGFGRQRAFHDMDAWGYSFRLGSAQAWFQHDATDARDFLREHGLIDQHDRPSFRIRLQR